MTWAKGTLLSNGQKQKIRQCRRTHTSFDGYENVPLQSIDSHNALSKLVERFSQPQTSPRKEVIKSLLLLALIDEKCEYKASNLIKRRKLFNAICQSLSNIGIVDTAFSFAGLENILQSFRNGFSSMMSNVEIGLQKHLQHADVAFCVQSRLGVMPILRNFQSNATYFGAGDVPYKSRYLEEFEELEEIGQGGFGIVVKARKLVDNCIYAVKKISFFYRSQQSLEKVAREVEFLAKLNHPNIVTYKTAWIEYELASSGNSATPSSKNSTMSDAEVSGSIRFEQQSKTESDSIQFLDDSIVNNYSLGANDELPEWNNKCQTPLTSIHYRNFTNSSLSFVQNCANVSSHCVNSELEVSDLNSYQSLSIKEITYDAEMIEGNSYDSDSLEGKANGGLCSGKHFGRNNSEVMSSYDRIPSSSLSRQRHGSGTTCKSHSDSEVDDVCTLQRRVSVIGNFGCTAFTHCGSVDATCQLLPLLRSTVNENYSVPFSSWHLKGTLYIQMELCAENLRDWLDERDSKGPQCQESMFDRVSEKKVMSIFRQVLKGVEHIHSLGLIHRDLKPQNIFFDQNHSKVKIGDFGLAACYCDSEIGYIPYGGNVSHTTGVGTTPYAALEQRSGQIYDSMADMYSLGVILVELLHPFGTRMERAECLEKLSDGIIPEEIKKRWPDKGLMIEKLLNKEPKLRPTATEVLNSGLFLNKAQVIEALQKDNSKLKEELKIKDSIVNKLRQEIREKENEIIKLKKILKLNHRKP